MKKVVVLAALALVFAVSCKKKQADENLTTNEEVVTEASVDAYEAKMKAPSFAFIVKANNDENNIVNVKTEGLANEYSESIPVAGKVQDSYMADLNNDGLHEFYVIVAAADNANLQILGFAVNNNESISMISTNELEVAKDPNTDAIKLEEGKLFRMFKANGEAKKYSYELVPNEGGYLLKPVEVN